MKGVILVEGISDERAVSALAVRRGRDLEEEGVAVVPTGGAHAIGMYVERYGPRGLDVRLAGLCDAGEESTLARGLERAGLGPVGTRAELEAHGFYICEEDLEHELVRALGTDAVEAVIVAEGELRAFHTFQKQLAKRDLGLEEQLWRFMWNRKVRYAPLLVAALDLERVPHPLDRVLAYV